MGVRRVGPLVVICTTMIHAQVGVKYLVYHFVVKQAVRLTTVVLSLVVKEYKHANVYKSVWAWSFGHSVWM